MRESACVHEVLGQASVAHVRQRERHRWRGRCRRLQVTVPRAGAGSSPSWEREEGAEISEGPLLLLGEKSAIVSEDVPGAHEQ